MRLNLVVLLLALGLVCTITPGIAQGDGLERFDPFNKNNIYGGSIKIPLPKLGGGKGSSSGLSVLTPPRMDPDGYIYSGTTRSDYPSSRVGRGKLLLDAAGHGWWHSSYSDVGGGVKSPVRAFAKYDRPTSPLTQTSSISSSSTAATATLVNASGSDVQLFLKWSNLQNESPLITLRSGEQIRIVGSPGAELWIRFDSSPYDPQIHEQRFRLITQQTTQTNQLGFVSIFRATSQGRVGLFDR
jgi:hypothetical protein